MLVALEHTNQALSVFDSDGLSLDDNYTQCISYRMRTFDAIVNTKHMCHRGCINTRVDFRRRFDM